MTPFDLRVNGSRQMGQSSLWDAPGGKSIIEVMRAMALRSNEYSISKNFSDIRKISTNNGQLGNSSAFDAISPSNMPAKRAMRSDRS